MDCKLKRLYIFSFALFLPIYASAAFECTSKVANILVYSDELVNILHSGRGEYTVICSLKTELAGVSISTCAMWVGMLQAIKKKDGLANFYYAGTGTCATLPTYSSAPVPVYIGDVTP